MSLTDLPEPLIDYTSVFNALLPLNALLVLTGFIAAVNRNHSPEAVLRALLGAVVAVALVANFPALVDGAQAAVDYVVTTKLQARPADVAEHYLAHLRDAMAEGKTDNASVVATLWRAPMLLFESVLVAIVLFCALVAAIVFFLAYVLQHLLLELGFCLAPLFTGLLMFNTVRSIGVQYLLGMTAIVLWPLGWAVSSTVTEKLMQLAVDQSFMNPSAIGLAYAFRNLLASLMLAVWIVVTTIVAPFAIQRSLTHGVHIGSQLLSSSANLLRRLK